MKFKSYLKESGSWETESVLEGVYTMGFEDAENGRPALRRLNDTVIRSDLGSTGDVIRALRQLPIEVFEEAYEAGYSDGKRNNWRGDEVSSKLTRRNPR